MADDPLFTLKQLADELHLPESTVRYYRDSFLDHIPSVGTGRRRRYPAQAIAVLRIIAKQYAAGKSRTEIVAAIDDGGKGPRPAVSVQAASAPKTPRLEEVSNLDLLAAILDGEREQRDALWQMAKEIVRLTEVLEGQDKVLNEIADRAGVTVAMPAQRQAPLLGAAATPKPEPAPAPAPAPPPATQIFTPPAAEPRPATPSAAPAAAPMTGAARDTASLTSALFGGSAILNPPEPPAPRDSAPQAPSRATMGHDDIEKLRAELESERQLVERLRESKLQLEHRVADAEGALEDTRPRRSSVIKRLLGSDAE